MRRRRATWTFALLLGSAALAWVAGPAAAADVAIADLVAHPDAYDGASVSVTGTVVAALPVGTESGYDLADGRLKLSVISRQGAPPLGARLRVTGTVRHISEGDDPEANEFPPVLVESAREPAP